MKSKTAVEFLFDKINFGICLWIDSKITDEEFFNGLIDSYKDALEFEREQIIKVAMFHKDSSIEKACIESYLNKHFKNTDDETI
jgi:hypothetical protein